MKESPKSIIVGIAWGVVIFGLWAWLLTGCESLPFDRPNCECSCDVSCPIEESNFNRPSSPASKD